MPIQAIRRLAEAVSAVRPSSSEAPARRIWDWVAPLAFYLALVFFIFARVFFPGDSGQVFFGWDTLNSYWPELAFRFRTLWRGELPLWNPYELGGTPFALDPQTLLFYPPSWLLALFAIPDGRLSVWGPQFFVVFHFLVVALGAHVLARRLGAFRLAAFLAGTTAILCAPVLTERNSSFLYPISWLPWLLVAVDRLLERPGRKTALAVALTGILAGSAANPPGVFVVVWVTASYAAACALSLLGTTLFRQGKRPALIHAGRIALWGGVAVAVALCYLAITYLPAAELLGRSVRAERGMSYFLDRALRFSNLPGLFNAHHPQTWWFDLFVGLVPLLALGPALLLKPDRRVWILAIIAALSVWVAIGDEGGLLLPAVDHLPGFTLNRKAYRYASAFGILAGPLAARGLSLVLTVVKARGAFGPFASALKNRAYAAFTVLFAAAAILFFAPSPPHGPPAAVLGAKIVPWEVAGLSALLCLGLSVPRFGRRFAVVVLAAVTAAQGAHLYWSAEDRLELVQPWDRAAEEEYARSLPHAGGAFRLGIKGPLRTGFASRELLRYAGGYEIPMQVDRHKSFMAWAKTNPARLRLFNLRYLYSKANPGPGAVALGGAQWEIGNPVPLVAVYSAVARVADGRALGRWEAADGQGLAIVEESDWTPLLDGMIAGRGERTNGSIERYGSNEIAAKVAPRSRGLAVFNEVYFPGWRAAVDGLEAPVIRCNHLLRGVVVDKGKHEIVLRYWPTGYGSYLMSLAASLLGLLALAVAPRLVRSRPRRG